MSRLSLLTWNVWFEPMQLAARGRESLRIAELMRPDIICLQEVTEAFLEPLRESSWIHSEYLCSDSDFRGGTLGAYGVLMLCKRSLCPSFHWHHLPSNMGRSLLVSKCTMENGREVCVGTVHLESLDNQTTREKQLRVCEGVLPAGSSILCGDFNFCSFRNYIVSSPLHNECLSEILPNFVDVW